MVFYEKPANYTPSTPLVCKKIPNIRKKSAIILPMPAPKFGAYNNQANAHRTYADTPKKLPFQGA
jgi:hypothetical protein